MEIVSDKKEVIFRNDYEGKAIYKIGLSHKKQDGSYDKGYILCKFKKDIELHHKTWIMIKQAWIDFYVKEKEDKKETVPYIFINDFEELDDKKETEVYEVESFKAQDLDTPDLPF